MKRYCYFDSNANSDEAKNVYNVYFDFLTIETVRLDEHGEPEAVEDKSILIQSDLISYYDSHPGTNPIWSYSKYAMTALYNDWGYVP